MMQPPCPIAERARTDPDSIAVISGATVYSARTYDDAISACTATLNVAQGDRIGIYGPASFEQLCLLHALWRCGAVAVPISPHLPAATADAIVSQLGLVDPSLRSQPCAFGPAPSPSPSHLPAVAVLTSGSTTTPKAVFHTTSSLMHNAIGANENMPLTAGDRWLLSLPLYHVSGLGILFRTTLSGATLVLDDSLALTDAIRKHRITHLSVVSSQLRTLIDDWRTSGAMTSLKAVLAGGSHIPRALVTDALTLGMPLHLSYGSTEMGSQITTTPADASPQQMETSGKRLRYRDLKISPDGEILVRGETLCAGYWRDGTIQPCTDADGWFHSGDSGQLDDDGYLTVRGRRDAMFISGGENIYPEEIENALLSLPQITQAAVVPVPNVNYGERPVAFIKCATDTTQTQILDALAKQLPRFKLPDALYPWPADTPEGSIKTNRPFLQERAQELWTS
jgi:o-succinylbenzoate---CoA ligase